LGCIAVSEELGEVVDIIGASADVWVILIYIGLDFALISKLSSSIVEGSKDVPGIFET
jgi:hypothetical protein